jgi:hypothetical protein
VNFIYVVLFGSQEFKVIQQRIINNMYLRLNYGCILW